MTQNVLDESMRKSDWHTLMPEEAVDRLNSHIMHGITEEEARVRLEAFGPNELKEAPRPTFWHRLWTQLKEFLVLLLIAASIISLVLGDYVEAVVIMAIVVLNAILGVVQESRAEEALAALKKMAAPEAMVVRDGIQYTIPTGQLVPGDLILLETGNYIPADIRLVEAVNLKVNEASLTGESVPVQKRADTVLDRELPLGDRRNTAYMSTVVTYGRGRGLVVSTGMHTQIGMIAQMVQSFEDEPTPLQKKLDQLGRTLGIGALLICGAVFLIGVGRFWLNPVPGVEFIDAILEIFMISVSLAIAAVPEGLPAVVTICLALGMQRMIKRHALLRQLSAVEALGSATVICSDKTGTLTQNAMTVVKIWSEGKLVDVTGEGYVPEGAFSLDAQPFDPLGSASTRLLLKTIMLCNDSFIETSGTSTDRLSWRMVGDPTEGALVVVAAKAGLRPIDFQDSLPRVAEIPFDSERKLMTTIHKVGQPGLFVSLLQPDGRRPVSTEQDDQPQVVPLTAPNPDGHQPAGPGLDRFIALVKGAPDVVLGLCQYQIMDGKVEPLTDGDRAAILAQNASLASQALRVLGAAVRPLDSLPAGDDLKPANMECDLVFTGLVGMIDPPRSEVKPAIEIARKAGIRTVMITGDYVNTAVAIAQQIGLLRPGGKVLSGRELDALDEKGFSQIVDDVDVYARVSPQHKVKIVEALQSHRQIVSMTGDGVNDAPALKRADIGVAMGITGTDVSKEASAMVLTDDNYASIVSAIEEGRIIYSNIRKFVFYLLSCNVCEILIIFIATLAGWPLPLTAIQLLVLNLLTDGAPALALGLEKGDPDIMEQQPRQPDEPVVNHEMMIGIVVQALVKTPAVLGAFLIGLNMSSGGIHHAQTMAFATMSISELLRAYTSRSERNSVFKNGVFSNKYMQYAVFSSLAILLAIIYVPILDPIFDTTFLTLIDWLIIMPLILLPPLAAEVTKFFLRRQKSV